MSTSPTPEEREKKDAEAKAKEEEEQSKLPYKWTQTIGDLDVTVPVPGNLKGKDFDVVLSKTKLKVGVKGQTPIIDVRLQPLRTRGIPAVPPRPAPNLPYCYEPLHLSFYIHPRPS